MEKKSDYLREHPKDKFETAAKEVIKKIGSLDLVIKVQYYGKRLND